MNEHNQNGNSFGERIANAIQDVFAKGFSKVITIGNDCPQLTTGLINNAALKLKDHQLVLGPDTHGGLYLIGLHKDKLDKASFARMAWQTPELYDEFNQFYNSDKICHLQKLIDVNNQGDLLLIRHCLNGLHKLRSFVLSIIAGFLKKVITSPFTYQYTLFSDCGLRAPPQV